MIEMLLKDTQASASHQTPKPLIILPFATSAPNTSHPIPPQALLGGKPLHRLDMRGPHCDSVPVTAAERAAAAEALAALPGATGLSAAASPVDATLHLAALLLQRLCSCELEGSLGMKRVLEARVQDWKDMAQQLQQQPLLQLNDIMLRRLQEVEAFLNEGRANGEKDGKVTETETETETETRFACSSLCAAGCDARHAGLAAGGGHGQRPRVVH